jgi:hypothetical protein
LVLFWTLGRVLLSKPVGRWLAFDRCHAWNQQLESLYVDFVVNRDGWKYISGANFFEPEESEKLILLIRECPVGEEAEYLKQCLQFTTGMINLLAAKLDPSIRLSIAALGELFTTAMSEGVNLGIFNISHYTLMKCAWYGRYLEERGGMVEINMVNLSWCRSDVERIRYVYQGLNTQYYISRLKKANYAASPCFLLNAEVCGCSNFWAELSLVARRTPKRTARAPSLVSIFRPCTGSSTRRTHSPYYASMRMAIGKVWR